jgi:hypothetical protein
VKALAPSTYCLALANSGNFKPCATVNLPVYLDAEAQAYLSAGAKARGVEVRQIVNELLKNDIELIEAAR